MVKLDHLRDWVAEPETHRKIIGDFEANYDLGVTDDPPALLLRVEGASVQRFPIRVTLHGQDVDVHVEGSYQRPTRLPLVVPSE